MTVFLVRVENDLFREIAWIRRDEAGRPEAPITPDTRICNNCNIYQYSEKYECCRKNPNCLRLNVLSQTSSETCLVCCRSNDIHRLTSQCRVDIFVKRNIYVPIKYVCCNRHLDEKCFLQENILRDLKFINRPCILKGSELQLFLQAMREEIIHSTKRKYELENDLTEEQLKTISPIFKEDFNDLFTYCNSVPIQGGYRYVQKRPSMFSL